MLKLRLKEIRCDNNLTQKQLAEITSLDQGYISKLEKDGFFRTKSPTLQTLETIANGLNACHLELFEISCNTCNKPDSEKPDCCKRTLENIICRLQRHLKLVEDFIDSREET